MAPPVLTLEQYQFDDTGVLLNGDTALPFVDIESVQGLDMADVRTQQLDREGVHGGYVEALYNTVRTVTLEGTVYASPSALETYLDSLKANYAPSAADKPLYFMTDSNQRLVFGKSLGFKYPKDNNRRLGIVKFQVQIVCQDPRIYSSTATTGSVAWSGGTLNVSLSGNRTSPGILSITGPVTSPTVTHTQSGTVFSFTGYTVAAGQVLKIDLGARSVLQGGVNKRNVMTMTGNWYELSPGTNSFTRTGTGTTGATTFAVDTRSAYY